MPLVVRDSSPVHWFLRAVAVAAIAALVVWIASSATPSTLYKVVEACALAIAAVSLNLLLGFNGQISIGHSTFAGLAAFTAGYTVNFWGWNAYNALVVAIILCFVLGFLIGLPALRLKGPYLALVTLAIAFVWPTIALKFLDQKVGKSTLPGTKLEPPSWTGIDTGREGRALYLYWVAIVLLLISYLIVRNLRKSRVGRSLVAVRDNETAAAVMGVNLRMTKTVTFGISASIAGVSGWLLAGRLATMDANSFTILNSIRYLLALFLGGAATLLGPIVGAFAYYFLDNYLKDNAPTWDWMPGPLGEPGLASFLLGVVVISFVFIAPYGLVGLVKQLARKVVVIAPRPLRRPVSTPPLEEPVSAAPAAEV
jgi:branched-chain amino acid transport system permease protein